MCGGRMGDSSKVAASRETSPSKRVLKIDYERPTNVASIRVHFSLRSLSLPMTMSSASHSKAESVHGTKARYACSATALRKSSKTHHDYHPAGIPPRRRDDTGEDRTWR